jgi:tetratricopeptide (TPR) repeat protein
LSILRDVGDRAGEATTLNNLGTVHDELGDRQRALEYLEQAVLIHRDVGDRAGESVTLFNIAEVREANGEIDAAITLLEQVVTIEEAIQHPNLASDRADLERLRAGGR